MTKNAVSELNDNYLTGFIRMYRSVANKGWYKKSEYVHLWVHLLTKATREPYEVMFDGKNIVLKPGQFVTGRKALEMETGINESKIERILTFFSKSEQQIEQQKCSKNRIISIKNWHLYQYVENSEQQTEQQLNNKRTTTEQQLNTNNKLNNINKEDKIDNTPILPVGEEPRPAEVALSREEKFVKAFNEIKLSKYKVTKEVKTKLAVAIKTYSPDQIISVIKSALKDPKHSENNFIYVTPSFVLREEIIERYLNLNTASVKSTPTQKIDHSLRD